MAQKRSESEILRILKDLKASGLSRAAFARREGISISNLHYWHRKYHKADHAPTLRRVEIVNGPDSVDTSGLGVFEVCYPSGVIVRIPVKCRREQIREILLSEVNCFR